MAKIKRYCCVLNMSLDLFKTKKHFIKLMSRIWDKEHRKKK